MGRQKGRGFARRLEKLDVVIAGFLDSNRRQFHQTQFVVDGYDVFEPGCTSWRRKKLKANLFVFLASVTSKYLAMIPLAEKLGWEQGINFETIQEASPFYPTVEVSGHCNLKML